MAFIAPSNPIQRKPLSDAAMLDPRTREMLNHLLARIDAGILPDETPASFESSLERLSREMSLHLGSF